EPTDEMATAAMNAEIHANSVYGEPAAFSDIWRTMLAAAPAVQGEPVAVMYEDGSLLSKADCGDNFEICCKVQSPLYTAPQPPFQLPDFATDPDDSDEVASLLDHGF